MDQSQQRLFELLIANKVTRWSAVALLALQLALYFFVLGYVQIEYDGPEDGEATVWVTDAERLTDDADYREAVRSTGAHRLQPRRPFRQVYALPFTSKTILVKPKGHPDLLTRIQAFKRTKLRFPEDFHARPFVLLRPTASMMDIVLANPLRVKIRVNDDAESSEIDFAGNAIWVGCDEDVEIPQKAAEAIKTELDVAFPGATEDESSSKNTEYRRWQTLWMRPSAFPKRIELHDEDKLHVHGTLDGETYFQHTFTVKNNMIGNGDLVVSAFGYAE